MSAQPAGDDPQVRPGLLVVLGVLVGVGALFALYYFVISPLLEGDGDNDDPDITVDVDVDADPDPSASPTPTDEPDELDADELQDQDLFGEIDGDPVPETFEIFTARDPFQQLVVQADSGSGAVVAPADPAATAEGAADAATTGGSTTTPQPTTPSTTTGGAAPATGGTTTTPPADDGLTTQSGSPSGSATATSPQSASVDGTRIRLNDVFSGSDGVPTLIVSVNGTTYEVKEGEVFAQRFQVLAIDGLCSTFLFGDSRFVLCEGESIVK